MSYKEPFTVNFVAVEGPTSTSELYANGRMPAPVRIVIRIYDGDDKRFETSEEWLKQNVCLVDYYDTSQVIRDCTVWEFLITPTNWVTSFNDGGWEHAGKPLSSIPQDAAAGAAILTEYITLYVKTGAAGSLKLAARVQTPDEKYHYSNSASDAKGVTIRAVAPRRYNTNDLHIEEVEIDKGDFTPPCDWVQTNTYISNKSADYPFVKVRPHNYHSASDSQPGWGYCWMVKDGHKHSITTRHWYTWPTGETKRTVGSVSSTFGSFLKDIHVNQRSHAACITLFETYPQFVLSRIPGWEDNDRWLEVWDKYGNKAAFTLGTNDTRMHVIVKDRAVTAEVETVAEPKPKTPVWVQDLPADVQSRLPELKSHELREYLPSDHPVVEELREKAQRKKETA